MILSFAPQNISSSFEKGFSPQLLTASNITVEFSKHPRILHNHIDRLELLYVRSGSGQYIVDNEVFEIKSGSVVITNSGVLHDEVPEKNRQLCMLSVSVTNVKIKGLPLNHLITEKQSPVITVKNTTLVDSIFLAIYDTLTTEDTSAYETTVYLTQALLCLILHSYTGHMQCTPLSPPPHTQLAEQVRSFFMI